MDPQMQAVKAQFEAILLQPMLEPLESAFGEYGEIAAQSFTQTLANAMASSW